MNLFILIVALSILPSPAAPVEDRVDLIEVNHYYDDCGKPVFTQLIFYDWHAHESRHHVRAWRMVREGDAPAACGEVLFRDSGVLRRVRAPIIRHTWTQHDPEIAEREHLPQHERRGLTAPRYDIGHQSPTGE